MARRFGSAPSFKASLETHLRKLASERKVPLSTLQLKFVIERLLARLFRDPEPPWLLKGGFAMDLRFRPHARTTKDVDLGMSLVSAEPAADFSGALRDRIQEAVDVDLGDYLSYRIGAPKQEFTNAPKGGVPPRHSRCGEQIESEGVRTPKVSVMEAAQKPETGYAVESLRREGDADNRKRLVEVELRDSDRNKVERKRT